MARLPLARLALRTVLSLPTPVLRLMSGGGVVYKGGRTLDPRLQFLAFRAHRAPPVTAPSVEQVRRTTSDGFALLAGDAEPGVACEDLTIEGPRGPIPLRAYRPTRRRPEIPALIYAHCGGGVVGDLETSHAFCSLLARTLGGPVVSVDYRLAPEHRFPTGLEDVLAAYRWTRDNAARLGAPEGRAAIGGDSIGGNFAAVICQALKRTGEPQPELQLLVYPATDAANESPSMQVYADAFPLTATLLAWFIGHYVGPGDNPADARLSPLREPDLSGLAPAIVATAGFDVLCDQGEAYARRLQEAGVQVTYRCYDSLAHGFVTMTGAVPAADAACRELAVLAREVLGEAAPIG